MPLPQPARRFTLVDAMILVAATAAGMASVIQHLKEEGYFVRLETELPAASSIPLDVWLDVGSLRYLEPCLLAWSLALLVLRLRPPRPTFRKVVLQPGTVVLLATAVVVAAHAVRYAAFWMLFGKPVFSFLDHELPYCAYEIFYALAAAWFVLALSRRLCCEKSWIDRAGRILGLLWIVLYWVLWWDGIAHI